MRSLVSLAERWFFPQGTGSLEGRARENAWLNRVTTAIVALLVTSTLAVVTVRQSRQVHASASGQWDVRYGAAQAIDGSDLTDWLPPDGAAGWIELEVTPARMISKVRVTNARNLPYADRATREYEIEGRVGDQVVVRASGRFDGFSAEAVTNEHPLGAKVEKVRLMVKSHDRLGGGFAEIELD